jgi:hypothetical protein
MTVRKFLPFLIIGVVLFGCKDDDIVSNRTIFRITFKDASNNPPDSWIVLRDDDTGELIDARMLDKTSTNVFDSKKRIKSGKMTVTYFEAPFGGSAASVRVFSGVDVGSNWTKSDEGRYQSDPDSPLNAGQYNLTINNVPPLYQFSVSDKYGSTRLNVNADYLNSAITISPGYSTGVKQLVTIDPQVGKQKYAFIEGISTGEEVVLDYSQFKEFGSYVHLSAQGAADNNIYVTGYDVAKYYNGYDIYSIYNNGYAPADFVKSDMNIGVLPDLPVDRFTINYRSDYYEYYGAIPSSLNFVHSDLLITDISLDHFIVQGTTRYKFSVLNYFHYPDDNSDPFIDLYFYSPEGVFKHFDPLTDEIVSKYSLKINKVRYGRMTITTGTRTYQDQLEYMFAKEFDSTKPYELTTINVFELN